MLASIQLSTKTAEAGLLNHRLVGGPFGRYYTMDAGVAPTWYPVITANAVNSWNATGKASFSQTTNYSISAVDVYAYDFGNTGWRGLTSFFKNPGVSVFDGGTQNTTANWDWAEVYLNHNAMYVDINMSQPNRSMSTAGHEFGHALSLTHSSSAWQLLTSSISRYDTYNVYAPQDEDIALADAAY
jgi:predicted Zn-dependent protease